MNETAPTDGRRGTAFEADELDQNAGETGTTHSEPTDPPQQRANKRKGHGTSANDCPAIISVPSRDTREHRFWVCDYADTRTCTTLIAANVPAGSTTLYTDEWQSGRGGHPAHAGDGQREVHCHPCEEAGAALRTSPRAFRGVYSASLRRHV